MNLEWQGKTPVVDKSAFIAPNAVLIGDVTVEADASIWFGAVLRGDFGAIVIRRGANVQDNVVVHVDAAHPTVVEQNATIGHGAVLEACTVERGAVIGMTAPPSPYAPHALVLCRDQRSPYPISRLPSPASGRRHQRPCRELHEASRHKLATTPLRIKQG